MATLRESATWPMVLSPLKWLKTSRLASLVSNSSTIWLAPASRAETRPSPGTIWTPGQIRGISAAIASSESLGNSESWRLGFPRNSSNQVTVSRARYLK